CSQEILGVFHPTGSTLDHRDPDNLPTAFVVVDPLKMLLVSTTLLCQKRLICHSSCRESGFQQRAHSLGIELRQALDDVGISTSKQFSVPSFIIDIPTQVAVGMRQFVCE